MRCITKLAAISLILLLPLFTSGAPPQTETALSKAIEMNFSAINMAKLAQARTKNPDVRAFAEDMVKDHTHVLERLKKASGEPFAEVRVSDPHQANADRLAKLSGAEFDREFLAQAVADYQDNLNFLEVQSKEKDETFARLARELKGKAMDDLLAAETLRQAIATGNTANKGNVYSERGTAPAPPSPPAPPLPPPSTNGGGPIP